MRKARKQPEPDAKYIENLLTLEAQHKLQTSEASDTLETSVFELLPEADINLNDTEKSKPLKSSKSDVEKTSYFRQILQGLTSRLFSTVSSMPSSDSLRNTEVRVLTLNDNEHLDSTLFRIEKSWILQFRIGPSLYGRRVHVYTNYPVTSDDYPSKHDEAFIRNQYRELPWYQDEGCKYSDDTSAYCEIEARRAGSYHYYFTYDKT